MLCLFCQKTKKKEELKVDDKTKNKVEQKKENNNEIPTDKK